MSHRVGKAPFQASFLSLTFTFALLTTLLLDFNNSENVTSTQPENAQKVRYFGRFFEHKANTAVPFGAAMGKYIKDTRIGEADYQLRKIVIDPGHGGRDGGCSGKDTREKEIALNIALKLGSVLRANYPHLEVIFTRTQDVFVPLKDRAILANEHQADLFISIHCNNILNASHVTGSETYVLGLHRAKDNLEVAKRENASIYYEDNYEQNYGGYDPHSPEGHIILSMFQNVYLEQSILLAEKIESQIKASAHQRSRGVRQAGFLVLRETTMPSVLVEAGYLSNRRDNAYLATDLGQSQIARAIFDAFGEYKAAVEGNHSRTLAQRVPAAKRISSRPAPPQVSAPSPVSPPPSQMQSKVGRTSLIIPSKSSNQTLAQATTAPRPLIKSMERPAIQYKVILAATSELVDTRQAPWNSIPYTVEVKREGGIFRYLAIGFDDFDAAVAAKQKLRALGFEEAFVAKFKGGKRVKN